MQFRQLTKDDIPSLLELYVQLDPKNAEPDCKKSLEIWERQIEGNPDIKYFGAVEGEKVVSSCYCVIIPNLSNYSQPICFVENVVTDKDFRKQGLARKVVQMAVEAAKSAGWPETSSSLMPDHVFSMSARVDSGSSANVEDTVFAQSRALLEIRSPQPSC